VGGGVEGGRRTAAVQNKKAFFADGGPHRYLNTFYLDYRLKHFEIIEQKRRP
jgi:hypothetical protein